MRSNVIETLTGAFVLLISLFLISFAYLRTHTHENEGYSLTAKFERIDGLNIGGDVRVGGIKIGTVINQKIDPKSYMAIVTIAVNPSLHFPKDSSMSVASEGLLGGKYLDLVPGGDEETIKAGGEIVHTQSAVNLESMIGQMIFSKDSKA
jgi:phospholipid/cholesterol/gamma-HCH transport system substrate-binding protein